LVRTTKKAERQHEQPLEIDVATVHHVERARLGHDLIQHVHVVHFAIGDVNECRNIAAQVQQRVHLDCCLATPESGPRKQCQAQIDGRRIQRI
jgi:hypothetical protein